MLRGNMFENNMHLINTVYLYVRIENDRFYLYIVYTLVAHYTRKDRRPEQDGEVN